MHARARVCMCSVGVHFVRVYEFFQLKADGAAYFRSTSDALTHWSFEPHMPWLLHALGHSAAASWTRSIRRRGKMVPHADRSAAAAGSRSHMLHNRRGHFDQAAQCTVYNDVNVI